jgi:hypothetical protein
MRVKVSFTTVDMQYGGKAYIAELTGFGEVFLIEALTLNMT